MTDRGTRVFWRPPEGAGTASGQSHAGEARPPGTVSLGMLLGLPTHWIDQAACGDRRDDLFFPIGERNGQSVLDAQIAEATTYCNRCPVRKDCLQWALENNIGHGIWGGQRFEDIPVKTRKQWRDQFRAKQRRWSA